eukprot:CAMPEP_0119053532 /NCGR_PEP_ID=MMETSP1177-20130426/74488_1 /TAXON_ID=2985 /ORGANISM="Ochromonas sp, Strain CCMP1899" /LENGTH=233 /DNA_ID=CAMNT_0007033509 /DNA_START=2212 /DNA_END=2913 /DNA_ORIENTATION=-
MSRMESEEIGVTQKGGENDPNLTPKQLARLQKNKQEYRRISPALSSLRNDPVMAFIFKEYDGNNDRVGVALASSSADSVSSLNEPAPKLQDKSLTAMIKKKSMNKFSDLMQASMRCSSVDLNQKSIRSSASMDTNIRYDEIVVDDDDLSIGSLPAKRISSPTGQIGKNKSKASILEVKYASPKVDLPNIDPSLRNRLRGINVDQHLKSRNKGKYSRLSKFKSIMIVPNLDQSE